VTRGPNRRKDFHINPGDEIFYQLEGELKLHYLMQNGTQEIVILKPGDLFLVSAKTPHCSRRREGSWTFIVERKRQSNELDRFIWRCEKCGNNLYEIEVRFDDPAAVDEATQAMKADPRLATCSRCSEVLAL
jgi:3-hydroxyanthranilate 3,4-dioxygenase